MGHTTPEWDWLGELYMEEHVENEWEHLYILAFANEWFSRVLEQVEGY